MSFARDERRALADTLRKAGPNAPTLCADWTTRDLAAHLILRERRLDAAAGIVVPALSGRTGKVQNEIASRDFDELVDQVAAGPPWYSPYRPLDRWVNLAEMFVHHEDVLRGTAEPTDAWTPRPLSADMQQALRLPLRSIARVSLGKAPVRVSLRSLDGAVVAELGSGAPVTVTGTPGELLLYVFGREPVDVTISGEPSAVESLATVSRGF